MYALPRLFRALTRYPVYLNGLLELLDCLCHFPLTLIDLTEIGMSRGILRVKSERILELPDRVFLIARAQMLRSPVDRKLGDPAPVCLNIIVDGRERASDD